MTSLTLSSYVASNTNVTVTTAATQVVAENTSRKLAFINNNSAVVVYIGTSGVTTTNGYPLAANGNFINVDTISALYGIVASGTADVRVFETN
jgi:hypothetical protein